MFRESKDLLLLFHVNILRYKTVTYCIATTLKEMYFVTEFK